MSYLLDVPFMAGGVTMTAIAISLIAGTLSVATPNYFYPTARQSEHPHRTATSEPRRLERRMLMLNGQETIWRSVTLEQKEAPPRTGARTFLSGGK
jgi:hypothetical protein